ncbi:hypothetical protein [Cucumibacter marinus]|uniref:hypothetical protein n=1 Tax=Cucumibacter marinus TaxID=1121252 RepID=UPI000420FE00|nr:hypothetical protein [Cucumibacter marinus]
MIVTINQLATRLAGPLLLASGLWLGSVSTASSLSTDNPILEWLSKMATTAPIGQSADDAVTGDTASPAGAADDIRVEFVVNQCEPGSPDLGGANSGLVVADAAPGAPENSSSPGGLTEFDSLPDGVAPNLLPDVSAPAFVRPRPKTFAQATVISQSVTLLGTNRTKSLAPAGFVSDSNSVISLQP